MEFFFQEEFDCGISLDILEIDFDISPSPPVPFRELPVPFRELPVPFRELPVPFKELTVPFKELTVPFKELTVPFKELTVPFKELTVPFRELTVPFKELTVPFRELTVPFKELTVPFRELTVPFRELPLIMRKLKPPTEKENTYKCHLCSFGTNFKNKVISHVFGEHPEEKRFIKNVYNKHLCKFCKKSFKNKIVHDREVHMVDGKYKCDKCDKKILLRKRYIDHSATHFKGNPYICTICKYGATGISNLKYHIYFKHLSTK
jgi:hypothetical protein